MADLAVAVACGARDIVDIEALRAQQELFGPVASDTTALRALGEVGGGRGGRIATVRAAARAHLWEQLPEGPPPVTAAGDVSLGEVVVLRVDATLVEAHSRKEKAAATYRKGFGHHPLGCWISNTGELAALMLRAGNANANTAADLIAVLKQSIGQVPARWRSRLLVTSDGAGFSHELIDWLTNQNHAADRQVEYSIGWPIDADMRTAIMALPRHVWTPAVDNIDGSVRVDCHRRAFAHFGGVPGVVVYDRTKTVVKRHVAPGVAVPLHPEAAAFAAHYGFAIDVLAAYRPTGKGRVERQVDIVRQHVLVGRSFDSLAELDTAFTSWVPIRRGQVHRTHGEQIGQRAKLDHAALGPPPVVPYLVAEQHLRRVGKDCLVSFEASMYSVPARQVRAGQVVAVRASAEQVAIAALDVDGGAVLATHRRAPRRGSWMVEAAHWDGLPDGQGRKVCLDPVPDQVATGGGIRRPVGGHEQLLAGLLAANPAAAAPVAHRPLGVYDQAAGLAGDQPGVAW
jgi:hypothetical protein